MDAQVLVLQIKGAMFDLPPDAQAKVQEAKAKLEAIVREYGDEGELAMMWVSLEIAPAE